MKIKPRLISFVMSTIIMIGCTLTQAAIDETVTVPTNEDLRFTPQLTEVVEKPKDRWMLYEDALAARLLSIPLERGAGYCEWEILGQEGQEVYLWAICQVADDPDGAATSAPVVVRISSDGKIAGVEMPRDGSLYGEDIRAMFPKKLHNTIFDQDVDVEGMWAHIQSRHANFEPPLIESSDVPLP